MGTIFTTALATGSADAVLRDRPAFGGVDALQMCTNQFGQVMIGSLCQGLRHMQAMRNIVKAKCSAQVTQNQQIIQLSFPLPLPALLNLFLRFRLARTRRPVFALNNLPMCRTSLASNAKEKGPCPKLRKAHTKAGFPRIPNGFYIPVWDSRREFTFPSGILYSREGFQSFRWGVYIPDWDFRMGFCIPVWEFNSLLGDYFFPAGNIRTPNSRNRSAKIAPRPEPWPLALHKPWHKLWPEPWHKLWPEPWHKLWPEPCQHPEGSEHREACRQERTTEEPPAWTAEGSGDWLLVVLSCLHLVS